MPQFIVTYKDKSTKVEVEKRFFDFFDAIEHIEQYLELEIIWMQEIGRSKYPYGVEYEYKTGAWIGLEYGSKKIRARISIQYPLRATDLDLIVNSW